MYLKQMYNRFEFKYFTGKQSQQVYNIKMKTVIIVGLLALCMSQSCPPFSKDDQIQSGNVAFANNLIGPRQHCYSLALKHSPPSTGFQVALSTSFIQSYSPTGGFDFSVRGGRRDGSATLTMTLMIDNDIKWNSMKVSYIVSSRNQIILGSFFGDTFYVLGCAINQDGKTSLYNYVPTWRLTENTEYKIAPFISGVRTKDSTFAVTILQTVFDPVDGRMIIQIQTNANPSLQIIYISYVVYPTTHDHFSFSYLDNPTSDGSYYLTGVKSFNNNFINYDEFKICKKGTTCAINQVVRASGQCECRTGYIRVLSQCKRQCAINAYISDRNLCQCLPGLTRTQQGCQSTTGSNCGQNQQWNGATCICKTGFFRSNGNCVPIPQCKENQVLVNLQCVCKSGYTKNAFGTCVLATTTIPTCKENEVPLPTGECICITGRIKVNDKCERQCAINAYFNAANQCVCLPNHQIVNRVCTFSIQCGANQIVVDGKCQCLDGYFEFGGNCWPVPDCPQNQVWQNTRCVCVAGYERVNTVCTPSNPCKSNEALVNGNCQCFNGFYRNTQNACVPIPPCGINQVWGGNSCICQNNFILNQFGQCVQEPVCQNNEVLENGVCVCIENYVRDFFRRCILPNCPQFSNLVNGQCVCVSGYQKDASGNCIKKCPTNQQLISGQCQCKEGYIRSNTNSCVLPPVCGLHEQLNTVTLECECEYGYVKLGPTCISRCAINQEYVNDNCVCLEGHAWVNGACRQCPSGSTPNQQKTTCQCGANQLFNADILECIVCPENSQPTPDKTTCKCLGGFEFNSDQTKCNKIVNCPPNSRNVGGQCICLNGFYDDNGVCKVSPTCPPGSQWDQQNFKCQCTIPNQYFINGICQSCGSNQIWVDGKCQCEQKYFLIGGTCRTCDPRTTYNGQDCVCNVGFYGTRDQCFPCHGSCGRCTGPQANDCISCVDFSYQLENGFCVRDTPCPIGSYQDQSKGTCQKCSDFCNQCPNTQNCTQCAVGFKVTVIELGGFSASFCQPICGDGRRNFGQQCDDGNTNNNDGCDETCREEDGWVCSGGTSIQKSTCQSSAGKQALLIEKGRVFVGGKVTQSIRMSYVPDCFTQADCAQCFKILTATVQDTTLPSKVLVNFVPSSKYQFTIQVDFQGPVVSTAFTLVISINQELPQKFDGCFTEEELSQQLVLKIDPALLIKDNGNGELSLDDLF